MGRSAQSRTDGPGARLRAVDGAFRLPLPPWVARMKKPRQDHAAGLPIGCEAGMRRPRRGLTRLPAIGSVTCARKDPLASRHSTEAVAREAGELLFALIHTVRSGCQTTVDRRGGRRCICEMATELSSAAWIIGQRNRFGHNFVPQAGKHRSGRLRAA